MNIKELILEANGHKLYKFGDNEFYLEFPSEEAMPITQETLATYFEKIYTDLF